MLTLVESHRCCWVNGGAIICHAQDAATSTLRNSSDEAEAETESEEIVVTATRVRILEDQSPASVSVVTSEEIEQRQVVASRMRCEKCRV